MITDYEDAADRFNQVMKQTLTDFLGKMHEDELKRFHQTLKLHLASADGADDIHVEELLEAVEFIDNMKD